MPESVPTDIVLILGRLEGQMSAVLEKLTKHIDSSDDRFKALDATVAELQTKVTAIEAGRKTLMWLAGGVPALVTVVLWLAPALAAYHPH